MKRYSLPVILAALVCLPLAAVAKLNVVATLPDFAAIAQEIGGDKIKVTSLARGTEDPHFVDARPSFIRLLNQADVLIEGGADLEIGWLPPLVDNARNRKILPGSPGRVDASQGVRMLEVPAGPIDRSQGDVHAAGNPHYMLDPANGKIVAASVTRALARLDPANAALYESNLRRFDERLDAKLTQWRQALAPYRGAKIITYHKTFTYLADRFGLEIVDQIEPKPGIEPTPTHITSLASKWKNAGVKLVIIEPNRPRNTPQYVADNIGARLLILPSMVEGHPRADTYINFFDYLVAELEKALR